jgi:multiple sugar transport system substrate-binding protein
MMPKKTIWLVLIVGLICSAGMLWAGGGQEATNPGSTAGEGFDWQRFEGTRLVINWSPNQANNYINANIGEFEALTGMKVEVDQIDYMRMHDKQVLEMTKSTGDYDLISLVVMWKTEYVAGDMLTELEPLFADANLAVPGYDFDDLVKAFVDNTGRVGGEKIYMGGPGSKLYCVPFGAETSLMAYRKDVLDATGVAVPKTYNELRAAFPKVVDRDNKVYAFTMRGASGHQATHGFLNHVNPFGGKVFDANWNPIVNNDAALSALAFMKEAVEYGAPGIPGFDAGSMDNSYLQGEAVFYIDHDKIAGLARDPSQSKVVGKVGYALHPKEKMYSAETGGFGIGIPANSANKEAAFLLMQWATSKEMGVRVAEAGGMAVRNSVYDAPQLQAKYPEFKVLVEQIKYADPDWRPIIPEWGEINQTIGVAVNQVLTGEKSAKAAMDGIIQPIRDIMQRAGYY